MRDHGPAAVDLALRYGPQVAALMKAALEGTRDDRRADQEEGPIVQELRGLRADLRGLDGRLAAVVHEVAALRRDVEAHRQELAAALTPRPRARAAGG